ncbi:cell envelope biogenesis protein OmpA [Desulfobacter hydrogenophilus]|uniref:Cell envelope biogenesis protein OmpA n=1 Tax=Desulfobacter hydrogenophilus TaxID=2291 RepID=A0A328F6Y2_9BACT|nr:OmpA family protein [Desulfobacter hydrogenophilus]NDY73920.1 OmpA family protein [Desulfobacter hydrogenophilus]QBH12082.1 cell envelope biogenesis protein OmpA [Desulfobacter hydrogenophilus]RAM00364.1 cell envelope biogenesis protein OmpA [Desulfobacter hydrogenophilus]
MNKKRLVQTLLTITAFLFLFGCAAKEPAGLPSFSAKQFDASMYQSKVNNFVIILDASSSMEDYCMGNPKFMIGKAIAEHMNMTIPELGQTAGLRSFGHAESISKNETELFYGMEEYNSAALAEKLGEISKAGGYSPIGSAIAAMGTDLESLSGKTAVIIISDGLDMEADMAQAAAVKEQYGDDICFYPIQVSNDEEGTAFLSEIAEIGGCAGLVNARELMSAEAMAAFVEKVFLENADAPAPVPAPMDSDGDGVLDPDDQCPGTPAGAKVNAVGCWVLDNVLFDFDKAIVKPATFAQLDAVYEILEKNPAMSVELQGHTDNIGSKKYNMELSLRRANAVANYLVDKGIARNRLATTGFGFDKPVALNSTDFGRSLNRRVEIHPY